MIILGIHDGHCASASIMIDGELKALAAEERFTRLKNDHGYPVKAIDFCLKVAGLTADDLDEIAFAGTSMSAFAVKLKSISLFDSKDWIRFEHDYWRPRLYDGVDDTSIFEEYWKDERFADNDSYYDFSAIDGSYDSIVNHDLIREIRIEGVTRHLGIPEEKIRFYDHHSCHAYYAFFGSPVRSENTMIYTLDGGGDGAVSALFRFINGRVEELARSSVVDIARIYRTVTLMMGMKLGEHEYKVMGLAPYATERELRKSYSVFENLFEISGDLIKYRDGRKPQDLYFWMREMFEGHRFDGISAALQKMVEVTVTDWFETVQKKYASRSAVFAGGVAMNVKLNMELAELDSIDEFHVCPSPSDDTLCAGACYMAAVSKGIEADALKPVTDPYLGPEFSSDDILSAINKAELGNDYTVLEKVDDDKIASWLVEGKVIARVSGRMEFGARALGNRSILGNPMLDATVEKINHQIKYRDFWMPFAPVVLRERAKDYFEISDSGNNRAYMMIGARTTEVGRKKLPAAIHRGDFTGRPQVLDLEENPGYYKIIKAFEKRTGVGCLLNTSFNLHGEPIVCNPEDALHTFLRSELDVLLMEDIAVMRG